ncbi:MAG TPA: MFS transporter [Candidatus Pelagibacter bacterium]|jgi:MFS family permease|nr:MFS transporter [Candidatus Pelagibacter bacterium]
MNKNLWILTLSQVFGFTAATITVFLSGIIGSQIASIKSLATLPTALYVVGTAIFTILAARIMSKIGRRLGFIFAALGSSMASLLGAFAISQQNFILFCISCLILGMGAAFNHQYRFAAAESVEKEKAPKAISILMLAGIVSAFLGITSANYTKNLIPDYLYVGSYLMLAAFTFIPAILLFFYKNDEKAKIDLNNTNTGRRLFEIIFQPRFLQAVIASAFAYAVMSFLMTATPLSMHVMEKMSLEKTGLVLQLHVAAMFLPSLITGNLIKKFGHSNIMYMGVLMLVVTIVLSLFEQSYANYMVALIFLGFGWNFLFISGTSLVVLTYKEEEKFKAQGINDLIVFTTMALASLSAGIVLSLTSWTTMNLVCIPFLVLIIYSIFRADILSKKD